MQTAESEFYYYGAEVRSEFQKLKIMSHISQHRSFISVIRPGPLETRFRMKRYKPLTLRYTVQCVPLRLTSGMGLLSISFCWNL